MSALPTEPEYAWRDALSRAARQLPPADPLAQIFFEDREDLRIEMKGGSVQEVVQTRTRGLSVRTGSRLVYQSDPEPDDAARLVRAAGAERSRPPSVPVPTHLLDAGSDLDPEKSLSLLRRLTEKATRASPTRSLGVLARWVGFRQAVLVVRPDGGLGSDVRRGNRVRLEAWIDRPGARSTAVAERVLRGRTADDRVEELADEVVRRTQEMLDARPARSGETPVVFAAGVGGILIHEIIGHALEADTVLSSASALAVHEGPVARPEVVVVDDPRRGRAPWRIDDEGEESRATSLVRGGKVRGWVSDLRSSIRAGRPSTGHGRRSSFHEPVLPRMGCTFLGRGALDPREVVEGTSRAILVRRMEAAGTDPGSGTAFFRVTDADQVRGGRLEFPLDPFLLKVTAREVLANLDRIADDLAFDTCIGSCVRDGQPLAMSVGAPTYRIGVATVFS